MAEHEPEDRRRFSPEFKRAAVERMVAGERPGQLAKELGIARKHLYQWKEAIEDFGTEAFPGQGARRDLSAVGRTEAAPEKPERAESRQAERRIAELEREVGRQQMAIAFFKEALRRVPESALPKGGSGGTTSTRSSKS
jgi:transposase